VSGGQRPFPAGSSRKPEPKKETLTGRRVLLREYRLTDAAAMHRLAGNPAVADNRLSIPYPFGEDMAEERIAMLASAFDSGDMAAFAVVDTASDKLVGEVSLRIDRGSNQATLSYWIGEPFWGLGYCTEAASMVVDYGFESLGLRRICARCLPTNIASQRVLQKLGMLPEGRTRRYNAKLGRDEDMAMFGLDREAWSRPG